MNNYQAPANDGWDLGFSALIEETPVLSAAHPTKFREIIRADGTEVYMLRQKPSWAAGSNTARLYAA